MVECSKYSIVEWAYEGGLKWKQSRCQRDPVRYQWDAYDCVYEEWMLSINLGGTAEVNSGFCPMCGAEAFLCGKETLWKQEDMEILEDNMYQRFL